jgi:hypothetical protein
MLATSRRMPAIERTIDVQVPVRTAYEQWTAFEKIPRFMDGIECVAQLDATHLRWAANVDDRWKDWSARITFHTLGPRTSRIMLHLAYDTQDMGQTVGDQLLFASHRAAGDLERFKLFIEWRGDEARQDTRSHSDRP